MALVEISTTHAWYCSWCDFSMLVSFPPRQLTELPTTEADGIIDHCLKHTEQMLKAKPDATLLFYEVMRRRVYTSEQM